MKKHRSRRCFFVRLEIYFDLETVADFTTEGEAVGV